MHTLSKLVGRSARVAVGTLAALVFADGAPATTSIDCDTPDDFCTGDPCVMTDPVEITVASCVLDFSPRALVLAKQVEVPNGGTLSLTAGSIVVDNPIRGQHLTSSEGDGADVSLIASGNITVDRRIDVSGKVSNGTILLDAGADIALNQRLRARARGNGATATGGAVTVTADGTVTSAKLGRIEVRGKKNHTPAGTASVAGQNGVTLAGRIDARGTPGGGVTVTSSAGAVTVGEEIRAGGESAAGGTVILDADGALSGDAKVSASGDGAAGGTVLITAGGLAELSNVFLRGLVGGTVAATAGGIAFGKISVRGRTDAGTISLSSTAADITVELLDGRAHDVGGQATVNASGDVSIEEAELDGGTAGGVLQVTAGGAGALGNSSSDDFDVTDVGGVIEVQTGGNLTLIGDFTAAVGGCIGLSAGGVLDVSGASFDVTPTGSCP